MFAKARFRFALTIFTGVALVISLGLVDVFFVEASEFGPDVPPIIRLHVIPNSDRPADQDLKLQVRNDLVSLLSGISVHGDGVSLAAAYAELESSLPEIEAAIVRRLVHEGSHQAIAVQLGVHAYDARTYMGEVFPEGNYISLEVVLGDGRGQNFWCIIFPSMCFVPDEVQVLAEERGRGNVAEAAEPGRAVARTDNSTVQFRWRLWERIEGARNARTATQERNLNQLDANHIAQTKEAGQTSP